MDRRATSGTGQTKILSGRGCASRNAFGHTRGDEIRLLRFLLRTYGSQRRRADTRERPLNRLMTQVAYLAGGFGRIAMMMPDASKRHGKDQQHEKRYWNNHVPDWPALVGHNIGNTTIR